MPNENSDYIIQAAEYWRGNNPLEAGRLIFENLPVEVRPRWASNILKALVMKTGIKSSPVQHILQIADDPNAWSKAHAAFSAARHATLSPWFWPSARRTLTLHLLAVAELVAKVTYNATNPDDEFDEDSGWWVAVCLKDTLNLMDDTEFSDSMWQILCFKNCA